MNNLFKMSNSIRWAFNFEHWHPSHAQFLLASSCLQPEEKDRIGKFVFKRDAKSSMIGRLLLRKFVAEHSKYKYSDILFKRDDRGKPYVEECPLSFSVSHQGSYVVLAGQLNNITVGVDIMPVVYQGGKNLDEFFRLMSRIFTCSEWEQIKVGTDEHKMLLFNRFWALKESYVKATGTGIVVDLQRISFGTHSCLEVGTFVRDTELFLDQSKQNDWLLQETLLDKNHVVAVATNIAKDKADVVNDNKFIVLSFEELMSGSAPLLSEDHNYCDAFFRKSEKPE